MRVRQALSPTLMVLSVAGLVACGGGGSTGKDGGAAGAAAGRDGAAGTGSATDGGRDVAEAGQAGSGGTDASVDAAPDAEDGRDAPVETAGAAGSGAGGSSADAGDGGGGSGPVAVGGSVLQRNNHATRDGLYIQPTLTRALAATMTRDPSFAPSIQGNVYAQPLYVESGPGGKGTLIVVTESNYVHAVAEADGAPLWSRLLGMASMNSGAGCGNIHPIGITGTPVIDLPSRTLFLDAGIANATNTLLTHEIHALSIDDGTERPGYPVDVSKLSSAGTPFVPALHNQRGALVIAGGILYVPYGGHGGDCGAYRGWVIGVPLTNPAGAKAWATTGPAGGIWAAGGLASDGVDVFAATGNTYNESSPTNPPPFIWVHGEAILRFKGLPAFSNLAADYFTPSNWQTLDTGDADLGGSGPLLIDVPGAKPSALVVALGKNGVAYLLDRANLGGKGKGDGVIGEGVTSMQPATNQIVNAATSYTTASGVYVVFNTIALGKGCPAGQSGNMVALKIGATTPPTMTVAWCADNQGRGSPITTTTDGKAETVVWAVGTPVGTSAAGTNKLHGYNGDTGAVIFDGGGAGDLVPNVHYLNSPLVVKGRIIVAANNALHAFKPR